MMHAPRKYILHDIHTREIHAHEMHAYEIYDDKVHAYETMRHAHQMYAHEIYAHRSVAFSLGMKCQRTLNGNLILGPITSGIYSLRLYLLLLFLELCPLASTVLDFGPWIGSMVTGLFSHSPLNLIEVSLWRLHLPPPTLRHA